MRRHGTTMTHSDMLHFVAKVDEADRIAPVLETPLLDVARRGRRSEVRSQVRIAWLPPFLAGIVCVSESAGPTPVNDCN